MSPTKSLLLTLLLSTPLPVTGVPTAAQSTQPARLRILIVHGPNLNLLGRREPSVYGVTTLPQINGHLQKLAAELDVELVIIQSNHEGVIVDAFQQHMDDVAGAVI